VVDGIVNGAAAFTRGLSAVSGAWDNYVIDGMVNGTAALARGIGSLLRVPQAGRIRLYVTMLFASITIAIAVAVLVVLVRS